MIWCVEDDAGIREIELYTLRAAGFEVRAFADGASFWEALKNERPDLVLLDVMLPGLDGMELLRRLRQHPAYASIPVIMATAKGNDMFAGFHSEDFRDVCGVISAHGNGTARNSLRVHTDTVDRVRGYKKSRHR